MPKHCRTGCVPDGYFFPRVSPSPLTRSLLASSTLLTWVWMSSELGKAQDAIYRNNELISDECSSSKREGSAGRHQSDRHRLEGASHRHHVGHRGLWRGHPGQAQLVCFKAQFVRDLAEVGPDLIHSHITIAWHLPHLQKETSIII